MYIKTNRLFLENMTPEDSVFAGGSGVRATVRAATEEDAETVGTVHCRAWLETYTGILPNSFLAARSPEKSAAFFRSNHCRDLAVAEAEGRIVGFCGWGAFRDGHGNGVMGEIQGIYLLDAYQRRGLGRKLMEYGLEELRAKGFRTAGLWVLAENTQAIGFYEKMGFRFSGRRKEADLGGTVTELLYVKGLE